MFLCVLFVCTALDSRITVNYSGNCEVSLDDGVKEQTSDAGD